MSSHAEPPRLVAGGVVDVPVAIPAGPCLAFLEQRADRSYVLSLEVDEQHIEIVFGPAQVQTEGGEQSRPAEAA